MRKLLFVLLSIIFTVANVYAEYVHEDFWDAYGNLKVDFAGLPKKDKAFVLDKYKSELEYCKSNLGKQFVGLDIKKIGKTFDYDKNVKTITNGLIAYKYAEYQSLENAARYFYKDYLDQQKCAKQSPKSEEPLANSEKCWPGTADNAPILEHVIAVLTMNNDYKQAQLYYEKEWNDWVNRFDGSTFTKKLENLKKGMETDEDLSREYNDFISRWEQAKKLAETSKPKPLDSAVQHHEWFYSDKQAEVLKALAYYHKHKVRFMLEKALSHKNPVIAVKAKQYLGTLPKENEYKDVAK